MNYRLGSLFGLIASMLLVVAAKADEPVALIEELENAPEAEAQAFDYAYKGDKIDLRPDGRMVLAYFGSCEIETITGGKVKMRKDDAKLSDGAVSSKSLRACRTSQLALDDESRELGAAVKRASPYEDDVWNEVALNTTTPWFKWPYEKRAKGEVTLSIYDVDAPEETLIWQTVATDDYVAYPADGPELILGKPYRVVAAYPKKYSYSAVFSIDPALEMLDSPLNSLVPLD